MEPFIDYVVYMTYDLHGQWDYGNKWATPGCTLKDGNCLRSHINMTETLNALSMITKAGIPTNKILAGVASYGRSFKMAQAGCTGPQCPFVGPASGAAAGPCTNTAGYITNAEIKDIIKHSKEQRRRDASGGSLGFWRRAEKNVNVTYDPITQSSKLAYNDNEWANFPDSDEITRRIATFRDQHFLGTSDWAVSQGEYAAGNGMTAGMYMILTSFAQVSGLIANFRVGLLSEQVMALGNMNDLTEIFGNLPDKNAGMQIFLDLLGMGFTLVASPAFNQAYKKFNWALRNGDTIANAKDMTMATTAAAVSISKVRAEITEEGVFVVDTGKPCGTINPLKGDLSDADGNLSWACVRGDKDVEKMYYIISAQNAGETCSTQSGCQKNCWSCTGNDFSRAYGIEDLMVRPGHHGGLTHEDFIHGAVNNWIANGRKNVILTIGKARQVNQQTMYSMADNNVRTAGVVQIPVCGVAEARKNWIQYSSGFKTNRGPNYPCDD